MWLSGQQRRPAENGEGQTGIVTMSGDELAVELDSERRGLELYGPAGYRWTPKVGKRVLVIQGRGETPCVVGTKTGSYIPEKVTVEAAQVGMEGQETKLKGELIALEGQTIQLTGETIDLKGQVRIGDVPLDSYIVNCVAGLLGGSV